MTVECEPFFGEPWLSRQVLRPERQVPVPIGEDCIWCSTPIEEGQFGLGITVWCQDEGNRNAWQHRECALRSVVGGIGHIRGNCSCHGQGGDPDAGLTYRESALAVWDWIDQHGIKSALPAETEAR